MLKLASRPKKTKKTKTAKTPTVSAKNNSKSKGGKLKEEMKPTLFNLSEAHRDRLDELQEKLGLSNRADVVRHLIDNA